jgi:hypothetical protein
MADFKLRNSFFVYINKSAIKLIDDSYGFLVKLVFLFHFLELLRKDA